VGLHELGELEQQAHEQAVSLPVALHPAQKR
jgi:hypothetical protein